MNKQVSRTASILALRAFCFLIYEARFKIYDLRFKDGIK